MSKMRIWARDRLSGEWLPPSAIRARLRVKKRFGTDMSDTMFIYAMGGQFFKNVSPSQVVASKLLPVRVRVCKECDGSGFGGGIVESCPKCHGWGKTKTR